MTVQELMRAFFSTSSKIQGLIVQENSGDGKLRALYSNNGGYDEQCIRPKVREAEVWKWGIDLRLKRIWITVQEAKSGI